MNKILKDSLVVGFAVFAVFFGAGNMIFPPGIGLDSGAHWMPAVAGLALSGIAIPILSIIATANMGDSFSDIARPVGTWFEKTFMTCGLFIIPFITTPRTGGVAFETGFQGVFPDLPSWSVYVFLIVYFGLTYLFVNNKSKIVDYIGQYLTPILLAILLFIVVMAFIRPIGVPVGDGHVENSFSNAFIYAYQLGDLLTGLAVASIYVGTITEKGYTLKKDKMKIMRNAAVVAFVGLFVVYGGLLYLGACSEKLFPADIDDTALLVGVVRTLLGNGGMVALGIAVILACLTTSIGLTAIGADFFEKMTKGKVSFKTSSFIIAIICVVQASGGVNKIIQWSAPVFLFMYPMAIVLTILGLLRKFIPSDAAWKGAIITSMVIGAYDAFNAMKGNGILTVSTPGLDRLVASIPFADVGFTWIVPCILGTIVGAVIGHFVKKSGSSGPEERAA